MRVVSGAENYLNPLRQALQNHFLPNLTALDLTLDEKILMCKPVRHVGMGIDHPVFNAPIAFKTSEQWTFLLRKAIKTGQGVNLTDYESDIHNNKNQARISKIHYVEIKIRKYYRGYQASNRYLSKES